MAQLTIQQAFERALRLHQSGQQPEAEQLYRQILVLQPDHAGALHYLGVLAHQQGRNDVAIDLIRRAIALSPHLSEAHNNLGLALKEIGRVDDAVAAFRRALALRPNYPSAFCNLGIALQCQGQVSEAISAFGCAVALQPNYAEAYNNLGIALGEEMRMDEAITAYRRAISLRPRYAQAHNNLGNVLREGGRLDAAISAYRRAIAAEPQMAEAHFNLGNTLKDAKQLDESILAYKQAIALEPGSVEAYNNLAAALCDEGQLDAAFSAYRQAIALRPDSPQSHSNLACFLHFHPAIDAREIAEELRSWNRRHAEPLRALIRPHFNDASPGRRLRIGYVSPDFRDHTVGYNLLPLFRQHDRDTFEITCYAEVARPDAITSEFRQHADRWRDIVGRTDDQVASQVREDGIDILVDLTLHTANNRLLVFARKPAPVQVTFAAYPGSTGLATIDYRLSDPYLDPPGMDESVYSEKTIRLPDSFWCYDPHAEPQIPINALPALASGAATFGCLNSFYKINDRVLDSWAAVMRGAAGSRLVLLAPQGSHRNRTVDYMARAGIEPQRIEFVPRQPRQSYLQGYHRIDLGLDSFPYNGHTTSLDSFWMGVPVVTLMGQTVVSRAGFCLLSNLRMEELVARTPDQFVAIATALGKDLQRLQALRSTLRKRMEQSPLMDAPRFARNIEAAYRQMWRRWCEAASVGGP